MKKYQVVFKEKYCLLIEAETKEEAEEQFQNGEYDNPKYLEITGYDITEIED